MPPYRSAPTTDVAQSPRDRGIVGDIIEQFADPYAFLRELVQNAIDADSPAIAVELRMQAELAHIAVRDRGAGMSRDVLENRLLVLFRSTKEGDDSKIGKFGVGFASVLAMQPSLIRVDSVFAGQRHVLHLYPDLSYELFDAGLATESGTTVELELSVATDDVDDFVLSCGASLERWCRHATVPITFTATDASGTELLSQRIDSPLALDDALAQVQAISRDGHTTAVVGIAPDAQPYAGFFNHGLTLHETDEPLLGRLAVKIQDPRLGHTLSRDNVRRDDNFERALSFARQVASTQLPIAAARAMREAAESADSYRYMQLVTGVHATGVEVPVALWPLVLTELIDGQRVIDAKSFAGRGAWVAGKPSALTRALASVGVPVVDLGVAGRELIGQQLAAHIGAIADTRLRDVHAELVAIAPVELSGADEVLLERLDDVLAHSYRDPTAIVVGHVTGARQDALCLTGGPSQFGAPRLEGRPVLVISRDDASRDPFRLLGRPPLVLNAAARPVARARALAETDPTLAAHLLARALLLSRGKLDEDRSERLLALGLEQLAGELP